MGSVCSSCQTLFVWHTLIGTRLYRWNNTPPFLPCARCTRDDFVRLPRLSLSLPFLPMLICQLMYGISLTLTQVLTGQAEMPAEGMMLMQNSATKLSCEVFVGNIPPETQAPTLQVCPTIGD